MSWPRAARTHLLLQTYVIIAVIYVLINFLLGQLAARVERRLGRRTSSGQRDAAAVDVTLAPTA